ncbi:MAG TPA: ATP-binding protein [Verrucomicrobiae bacterium]|nr:ATP-binding protein [Verrucomicrobiae bacterium]
MLWPALAILFLVVAVTLHFRWQNRFNRAQSDARRQIRELEDRLHSEVLDREARQQRVFDSMVEGLLVLDPNDRIELANRAFIRLFQIDTDVRGKTVLEVLRRHELAELLKRADSNTPGQEYEFTLEGSAERWLHINSATLQDSEGTRQGAILVFHDLTRVKQLERTREEFVANVSHELRTPLSLIKGYVETLLDGARDDPELSTKFLHTIRRNSERLQFLIEDLLTISELESGRMAMNVQPVSLRAVIDRVIDDHRSEIAARRTVVENESPEMMIDADSDRLHQVLGNLISNALKYGKPDGTVQIGAQQQQGGWVHVWVQDDGPGIPLDALGRVFERFYRVDKARSRETGGTGLGLSIVKHIVQSHGGTVWAESDPGKGATFHFTIPAHVENP